MFKNLLCLSILLNIFTSSANASQLEVERELFVDQTKTLILSGYLPQACEPQYNLSCEQQGQMLVWVLHDLYVEGYEDIALDAARAVQVDKLSKRDQQSLRQLLAGKSTFDNFLVRKIKPATKQQIQDLYFTKLNLQNFRNGKYENVPKIYVFCRYNRVYPCRAVLKDKYDRPILNAEGELRSFKMLAFSRHQRNFNEFKGNTPSGVYLVNGVMPEANKQLWYGKYRRLILDFIPESKNESVQKMFLPASSHNASWWYEAKVARDMGRALFRIHGTGHINRNRFSPHYGFYGTSGCVQTRENEYDGVVYRDQQELLDELMLALEMSPEFENEPKIKALLYVINIDGVKAAVERNDLAQLGIR